MARAKITPRVKGLVLSDWSSVVKAKVRAKCGGGLRLVSLLMFSMKFSIKSLLMFSMKTRFRLELHSS